MRMGNSSSCAPATCWQLLFCNMPRFALALAIGLLATACSNPPKNDQPQSVVLVTFDTTRADVLGCYGGKSDTSPNLDKFAREAIRFERAWTVAPLTLPAHSSMLTGIVPSRHGVRDNGRNPLPEQALSVAEVARDAGIQTGAMVSSAVLNQGFGLGQGFDVFRAPGDSGAQTGTHFPSWDARTTLENTDAWLNKSDPQRGIFLWVHFWEPHAPYQPSPEFKRGNPYLGDVAMADHAFGELLKLLDKHGRSDSSTIIMSSDHGEAFGEHDEQTHGALCFNTTMQVPLIVRPTTGSRGVDSRIASVVDIAPTIADGLGIELPGLVDGESLLAEASNKGAYIESLQCWYAFGWSPIRGWVDESGKYLRGGVERFLDFDDKVLAGVNQSSGWSSIKKLDALPTLTAAGSVDSQLAKQVEALGYAVVAGQASQVDYQPGQYLDPADCGERTKLINQARSFGNQQKFAKAVDLCRKLLRNNPDNMWANDMLGGCLLALDKPQEAIGPLQRVVMAKRASARTYINLAVSLFRTNRKQEAIPLVRKALEMNPDHQVARALAKELGISPN